KERDARQTHDQRPRGRTIPRMLAESTPRSHHRGTRASLVLNSAPPLEHSSRLTMLDRIRIVLIGTSHPGNLGGTARAMKNMGLDDLALVAPRSEHRSAEAISRASGADTILAAARRVDTLEEA